MMRLHVFDDVTARDCIYVCQNRSTGTGRNGVHIIEALKAITSEKCATPPLPRYPGHMLHQSQQADLLA